MDAHGFQPPLSSEALYPHLDPSAVIDRFAPAGKLTLHNSAGEEMPVLPGEIQPQKSGHSCHTGSG